MSSKNLLEWKDEQGNKINIINLKSSSSTSSSAPKTSTSNTPNYQDKFECLLDYHMAHVSMTKSPAMKQCIGDRFHYGEEVLTTEGDSVKRDVVTVITEEGEWLVVIFIDGQPYRQFDSGEYGKGITNLMQTIEKRGVLIFPPKGSKEYQKLLTEQLSFAEEFAVYNNLW